MLHGVLLIIQLVSYIARTVLLVMQLVSYTVCNVSFKSDVVFKGRVLRCRLR
jgi:hypothetical protein